MYRLSDYCPVVSPISDVHGKYMSSCAGCEERLMLWEALEKGKVSTQCIFFCYTHAVIISIGKAIVGVSVSNELSQAGFSIAI